MRKRHRSRSRSSSSSRSQSTSSEHGHELVPVCMPDPDSKVATSFLQRLHETNAARSDKIDSIIYADNLSKDTTEEEFVAALVKSMQNLGLLTRPGYPLVKVWKPKKHTFIMMDFRCVEEANNCLLLHGMTFKNKEIKVSRPKHYTGSQPTNSSAMNCLFGNFALKNVKKRALEEIASEVKKNNTKSIEPPSRVLSLKKIITSAELQTEYQDFVEDIRFECEKYGKVESLVMPRPGEKGAGNAYVEYNTVEEAMAARRVLATKRFNGKFVVATFHPEVMYLEKDFRETWELRSILDN